MIRGLSVSALVALVGANRVQIHLDTIAKSGASCDDLHTSFSNRLASFQESIDSLDTDAGVSRGYQTRQAMRVYGIMRTLRRARSCSWVMDSDSEDMVQAQGIAQTLLAGNPCADAARSEMEAGLSAGSQEAQAHAMTRAVSMLMSDTCEASEIPDDAASSEDELELDAQLSETEEQVQDGIQEMMEASEGQEGSFIQLKSNVRLFRVLGVIFLMLFLLVACTVTVTLITMYIVMILSVVLLFTGLGTASTFAMLGVVYEGAVLFPPTIVGCGYLLYNQVLPRLTPQQ